MTNIRNSQGQKYTLQEYFRYYNQGLFQIVSIKSGETLITGDCEYIKGHLQNHYFGACIQGVDVDEYGTIIYFR